MYPLRRAARRLAARGCAALGLATVLLLTGCHNFFVCEGKASCPSGGGGSTTSDWVYVSNASAGSTRISAYDIGNGSLAAISGSPYNIGFAPVAMSVSPSNAFLYVATLPNATNPGIYMFAVNSSTGALSTANGGNALITTQVSSMDISPDGNFLFVVDVLGTSLTEYQINTSTGLLALGTTLPLPPTTCVLAGTPVTQSCTVKVAPSGQFVVASLGSAGTIIYPYTSSSGITSSSPMLIGSGSTSSNPTGDYSVTLDKNNFIYIARTSTLAVYQITDAAGDATLRSTFSYSSTATTPRSVVLSSRSKLRLHGQSGNRKYLRLQHRNVRRAHPALRLTGHRPCKFRRHRHRQIRQVHGRRRIQRQLRLAALHRRHHRGPHALYQRRHRNLDRRPRSSCLESLAPTQTSFNPPRIFARTCLLIRL